MMVFWKSFSILVLATAVFYLTLMTNYLLFPRNDQFAFFGATAVTMVTTVAAVLGITSKKKCPYAAFHTKETT